MMPASSGSVHEREADIIHDPGGGSCPPPEREAGIMHSPGGGPCLWYMRAGRWLHTRLSLHERAAGIIRSGSAGEKRLSYIALAPAVAAAGYTAG